LVCLAFLVDCSNPSLALILLGVQGACLAGMVPGVMTSMLSLAPAYSGTLSSLCMTIGMTGSIVAPIFVGHVNNHVCTAYFYI
jgi:MFS family permease